MLYFRSPHSPDVTKTVMDILPHVISLTEAILSACRSSLIYQMHETSEASSWKYSLHDYIVLDGITCMSGASWATEASLSSSLPSSVRSVLDKWKAINVTHVPWNSYANDVIPAESYILATINHITSLSEYGTFSINPALKNLLHSLVTFMAEYVNPTVAPENSDIRAQAIDVLIPLSVDSRTDYLHEMANKTLGKLLGDVESEAWQLKQHLFVLHHTYNLIVEYTNNTEHSIKFIGTVSILVHCIKYWEKLLDKPVGCKALDQFFSSGSASLVCVLLSIASPQVCHQFSNNVLHFFNKLFNMAEKSNDASLNRLCSSISNLALVENEKLQAWLRHVILGGNNLTPSASSANIQTPTIVTATTLVAVTGSTTDEVQKAEEPNNAPNSEQVQWQTLPLYGSNTGNQITSPDDKQSMQENSQLLQALTSYIVHKNSNVSENVSVTILQALIPIGYHILSPAIDCVGFCELMQVMSTLADAGSDKGHVMLFKAATEWAEICKHQLINGDAPVSERPSPYIEAGCCILNYIADIVNAVCPQASSHDRATSPPWEGAMPVSDINDSDWLDEIAHDDDDSAAEDSDEDSLCNKLCTFTITLKEFMNQHWYHCHTCNMVDGVGVCTVCARVCHRGHDVTYAKYGNFFCDCGAKEDGSCQALTKRSPQGSEHHNCANAQAVSNANNPENSILSSMSNLRRRASSPVHFNYKVERTGQDRLKQQALAKQLEGSREWVVSQLWSSGLVTSLVELTDCMIPAIDLSCQKNSPIGCHARAQEALYELHTLEKRFEHTDQLMLPTLGSQEGAFENVRMNYSGDQGQTIRQLLSAHMIRRVAMCCLSSPYGKRQHLAVSHEKGKITVLQLNALLRQADSSKRKLTLTRLASAPIPFTVLTITGNQWNEDFLAVCGLKDCHVLTFNSSGTVSDHLVLHPQLETGNFIIKAMWLPGSQTQLALVTADFVKIYDLGKDALSPQYYFLVPTGKIRDCTFVYAEDGIFYLLLMSSAGNIYNQAMDESSLAKHGPFYVTSTLNIVHPEIKENGQINGGGVSIYYSHALQLLFFSYACGKSFIAPLKSMDADVIKVFMINLANNKTNGNKSSNNQPQPLCQWSEVPNHPGLVCSIMQTSNNPVILMIKPDTVMIHEIKVVPAKAKTMDMVAIRHFSSNAEHRTTLIILCEDGSLKIYMAGMEHTGYWMSSTVKPINTIATVKQAKKKKAAKAGKPSGSVSFPIDFFEHCQIMNDVEFGGNDLLQIYNVSQIKHRLNTTGMYVVSTKAMGFNIEISNNDPTLVITGIRVFLGNQDIQRAPVNLEIFGRKIFTTCMRSRWFDIPLTREESLQADKKLVLSFGPSHDPEGVIMVDSIKVYGKTKDAFGWPEESEESPVGQSTPAPSATNGNAANNETESAVVSQTPLTPIDKLTSSVLEVLESSFTLSASDKSKTTLKIEAVEVASSLLKLPTPSPVQVRTTSLLTALFNNKQAYHSHKDLILLNHVLESLREMREVQDPRDIDAENFYRLVLIVRSIAISRSHNLAKFAEQHTVKPIDETKSEYYCYNYFITNQKLEKCLSEKQA